MPSTDPRVDAYIAKSAAFAQPVLVHLRGVIHAACPEVEETIKWGMPSFLYQGGILCGIAAFKQHCSLWFWKARGASTAADDATGGMGQFGRITGLSDLPSKKELADHVRAAMHRKRDGATTTARKTPVKSRLAPAMPEDLAAVLKRNAAARKTFEGFSASCKREYIDWITEAKRDETRERRLVQAIEWMAEGKQRNWKHQKR